MKITGEERSGLLLFERMDWPQLFQGVSDQTNDVADAPFLLSVVALAPFLSISVCWFWFRLS